VQTGKVLRTSGRAQLSVGSHLTVVAEERAVDELLAELIGRRLDQKRDREWQVPLGHRAGPEVTNSLS
jgi:hypothetical protein